MNRSFSLNYYYFEIVKVLLKPYLIPQQLFSLLRFLFISAAKVNYPLSPAPLLQVLYHPQL
jgi:hypothetical protein